MADAAAGAETILLADIGGTTARFALLRAGRIETVTHLPVADYAEPLQAVRGYLAMAGGPPPRAAAMAVAGPVEGGCARLTNGRWTVEAAALTAALDLRRVRLVNDFEAQAWALPRLGVNDLVQVGRGSPHPGAAMAVLGPGTGLGVAGFLPDEEAGGRAVVGEGGHATLAAADAREAALIARLREAFGHASAERALSGPGLVNLARAIAAEDRLPAPPEEAEAVVRGALDGRCPACAAALEAFCALLGGFAGDLALLLGARGGVYLAGGIVPRFIDALKASSFRARFEAKGRFCNYLAAIPTYVVVHPDPAFLGLAALSESRGT